MIVKLRFSNAMPNRLLRMSHGFGGVLLEPVGKYDYYLGRSWHLACSPGVIYCWAMKRWGRWACVWEGTAVVVTRQEGKKSMIKLAKPEQAERKWSVGCRGIRMLYWGRSERTGLEGAISGCHTSVYYCSQANRGTLFLFSQAFSLLFVFIRKYKQLHPGREILKLVFSATL